MRRIKSFEECNGDYGIYCSYDDMVRGVSALHESWRKQEQQELAELIVKKLRK